MLAFASLFFATADTLNYEFHGYRIKLALVVMPLLFLYLCYRNYNSVRELRFLTVLILFSFLPSFFKPFDYAVAFAFYAGLIVCVMCMWAGFFISRKSITIEYCVVKYYRISIIFAFIIYICNVQDRVHLLFYEPSYYAIGLIPYFVLSLKNIFDKWQRSILVDIALSLSVILLSQSASMLIYFLAILFWYAFRHKPKNLFIIFTTFITCSVLIFFLISFNERASEAAERFSNIFESLDSLVDFMIFIGGNRLQKAAVAFQVAASNLLTGVGLGCLKEYSLFNYSTSDFVINGYSAYDFDLGLNNANIYLEMAAEAGLIGLIGYLLFVYYVIKRNPKKNYYSPFQFAVIVTSFALIAESSFLRPYVWLLFGFALGDIYKSDEKCVHDHAK